MVDLEKRRRIMGRSVKLGHCICNPKEPCPCDLFKRKNVCLCAGEREEEAAEDVALTKLVENAGCASKVSQEFLKQALEGLPAIFDPRVLVSSSTCDDAGIFKLNKTTALVQTVDVFSPCVDDPYVFGQIAAANSVSDVYAMGGKPLTALSIVGFPSDRLSPRIMNKMLQGGIDKLAEAGVPVLGGHSIKDPEVKFGFAVTGVVRPDRIMTNDKARPGNLLILTKPLGTGLACFAQQLGKADAALLEATARSMTELNGPAAEEAVKAGVRAATDVTGFGLLGHLAEMAVQSRVTAEIWAEEVPLFKGVLDLARKGVISGAVERNREYAMRFVTKADDLGEEWEAVLLDPQTSGGLLLAVPRARAAGLLKRLAARGAAAARVIGRVVERSEGAIRVGLRPEGR
ncbi:MAG: selenide, water dikinase SelD [Candidatus Aminicenantes bacterium]|nr:selenide, water dikinase SelD [Candidatus Aminicenantes bacterium]